MKPDDDPVKQLRKTLVCMDSGVGGLAVLKRLVTQLPRSPYTFVGDTAWMPYGEKELSVVRGRVLDVHQWINNHYDLAVFVLACNTATVAAYDDLEVLNLPYPLLEPVKTTSLWVNQHIAANKKIGILATPGTVTGQRYLRFLDNERDVMQIACTGLASLIESGVCSGPALDELLLPYLEPLRAWGADVIILGCTHYSLIEDVIQAHVGPQVQLVDSATVLAEVATPLLKNLNLGKGTQELLVTGDAEQFQAAIQALPLQAFHQKTVKNFTVTPKVTAQLPQ